MPESSLLSSWDPPFQWLQSVYLHITLFTNLYASSETVPWHTASDRQHPLCSSSTCQTHVTTPQTTSPKYFACSNKHYANHTHPSHNRNTHLASSQKTHYLYWRRRTPMSSKTYQSSSFTSLTSAPTALLLSLCTSHPRPVSLFLLRRWVVPYPNRKEESLFIIPRYISNWSVQWVWGDNLLPSAVQDSPIRGPCSSRSRWLCRWICCWDRYDRILESGGLPHELFLHFEIVATGKGNNTEDTLTFYWAHNLLKGEMTVDHHNYSIATTDSYGFDNVPNDVQIWHFIPQSTAVLAHLIHVLPQQWLFMIQGMNESLIYKEGDLVGTSFSWGSML